MNQILKLITDFSQQDSISKLIISSLFNAIKNNKDYSHYYSNWKKVFVFLHGELNSQRKINTENIAKKYGVVISQREDLFVFAYILEIFYSVLLKFIAYRKLNGESKPDLLLDSIIGCSYFLKKRLLNYSSPEYYNFVIEISETKQPFNDLLNLIQHNPKIENDYDFIKIIYE